jgi:transcriptional regulator with XRE-family HTH domain
VNEEKLTNPTSEEAVKLGKTFRAYRKAAGVTLRDLGKGIGMSINTIRQHEAGSRLFRVDDIHAAARFFGVPPQKLIEIDPSWLPTRRQQTRRRTKDAG